MFNHLPRKAQCDICGYQVALEERVSVDITFLINGESLRLAVSLPDVCKGCTDSLRIAFGQLANDISERMDAFRVQREAQRLCTIEEAPP